MQKLTFSFKSKVTGNFQKPLAIAFIELTENQFENFFKLHEIAVDQKLASVEMFMPGIKWDADAPPMESAEFIIHSTSGVALKANPLTGRSHPIQSCWIDWGTLDLLYVLKDDDTLKEVPVDIPEKITASREVSNDIQLV